MIELDAKVYAIDKMLNIIGVLKERIVRIGFRQETTELMEQLKAFSEEAGLDCIQILEYVKALSERDEQGDKELVMAAIEKLSIIVQKEYVAVIHSEHTYRKVLLENYYQTDYSKNILIMYIVYPFLFPDSGQGHTNQIEAIMMAEVFRDAGYNVDLVNTRYEGKVELKKYDTILGSGLKFEEYVKQVKAEKLPIKTICYLTECSPYFSNKAELSRLRAFEKRNHYLPQPERMARMLLDLSVLMKVDAAICIGNQVTVKTYEDMFSKLYPINVTGFDNVRFEQMNRTSEAKKNFMWYGGMGPIHKGLDLLVEAFRELPELNLHIVGGLTQEFYDFYKEDLENGKNIYFYNFLDRENPLFAEVCNQCGFVLMPSCSESQSTAMITTMFSGMVPIGTPETGIDLAENGGVLLEQIDIPDIQQIVRDASVMDVKEFEERQKQIYEYVMNHHTAVQYRENLNRILACIS